MGAERRPKTCATVARSGDPYAGGDRNGWSRFSLRLRSLLAEIGDMWRDFGYKASKVFKRRAGDQYTYSDLADMLDRIGEAERAFYLDLLKTVEQHIK